MRKRRRTAMSTLLGIASIFALIGTILVIGGVFTLKEDIEFKNNAEKTTGIITEIERYNYSVSGKTKTGHHVWVRYYVDDIEYNTQLNEYTSSMREGKEITLYYDAEYPDNARTGLIIAPIILMGIGGLFAGIGIVFFSVNAVQKKRRRELIENGDMMTGVITDVKMNMRVKINNRHPFKAECEVIDIDSQRYLYSSENVIENITMLVGRDVTVYVDRQDKSKYYVDIYDALDKFKEENKINDFR